MNTMWEDGDKLDLALKLEECGFDKEQPLCMLIHMYHVFPTCLKPSCLPKPVTLPKHASQLSQEKFLKQCEMINTKKDSKKNKEDMGWYSKEDMSKVLHWNPTLDAL